jgi:hypothetical protein
VENHGADEEIETGMGENVCPGEEGKDFCGLVVDEVKSDASDLWSVGS